MAHLQHAAAAQTGRQQHIALDTRRSQRCRRKFLHYFPRAFRDPTYVDWERAYKWDAHESWQRHLGPASLKAAVRGGREQEAAAHAVRMESRTNLLFSFEKMALRDAVRSAAGAKRFVRGLLDWLHGPGTIEERFPRWCEAIAGLPRRQTRVLTWPLVTVFGFIAQPRTHMFLKPNVTRAAATRFGVEFPYASRPTWDVYSGLLAFAAAVRRDVRDLRPRDMIDIQSYLWVQGSDEYPD